MKYLFFCLFLFFNNFIFSQILDDFVFVEGGTFKMGDKKNKIHKVTISDFYIMKTEVTNIQYVNFLKEKGNQFEGNTKWIDLSGTWRNEKCKIYEKDSIFYVENGFENYPVVFVSWWGANAYAKWLGGRLPTEAEWEYLANKCFSQNGLLTEILKNNAILKENSNYLYEKVKSKSCDLCEIYDLIGNLSEWCQDWYDINYYNYSPKKNPNGAEKGDQKAIRGYSWADEIEFVNIKTRFATNPNNTTITLGFRVVIEQNKKK
jgi:formylglycine-generating enzyme required for sulfatase activity